MSLSAFPRRFKRPHLLIVGCGDVGLRVARLLSSRWHVMALTSSPARVAQLRASGIVPIVGNLDLPMTLTRLAGCVGAVLHLAPPAREGHTDERTRHLLQALSRNGGVRRLVYGSTSGVYGDAQGARVTETHALCPGTDRARRRVDAERQVREFGQRTGACVTVLRIPGIYGGARPGGHPRARLIRGEPVLCSDDDVYTNHVHADDLARICAAALHRGGSQRVINASDDSELKMGDYFDLAADLCGLQRPPRVPRERARALMSEMQWSFMSESRRLDNRRLKSDLRLRLHYPTVVQGLAAG